MWICECLLTCRRTLGFKRHERRWDLWWGIWLASTIMFAALGNAESELNYISDRYADTYAYTLLCYIWLRLIKCSNCAYATFVPHNVIEIISIHLNANSKQTTTAHKYSLSWAHIHTRLCECVNVCKRLFLPLSLSWAINNRAELSANWKDNCKLRVIDNSHLSWEFPL